MYLSCLCRNLHVMWCMSLTYMWHFPDMRNELASTSRRHHFGSHFVDFSTFMFTSNCAVLQQSKLISFCHSYDNIVVDAIDLLTCVILCHKKREINWFSEKARKCVGTKRCIYCAVNMLMFSFNIHLQSNYFLLFASTDDIQENGTKQRSDGWSIRIWCVSFHYPDYVAYVKSLLSWWGCTCGQ